MIVFVYVNTSKQVGDPDHLKLFATVDAAEAWFEENDPEGVALNMRFWNKHGPGGSRRGHTKYSHSKLPNRVVGTVKHPIAAGKRGKCRPIGSRRLGSPA